MNRLTLPLVALLGVAGCETSVPNSASGVGFGDYTEYRAQQSQSRAAREAQLSGTVTVLPPEDTGAPTARGAPGQATVTAEDLAAAGIGPAQAQVEPEVEAEAAEPAPEPEPVAAPVPAPPPPPPAPAPQTQTVITPAPGTPLAATAAGAAYAAGTDPAPAPAATAAPVAAPAAAVAAPARTTAVKPAQPRREATPAGVPRRPRDTGPDIVAYALQTTNPVGQPVYSRSFASQKKAQRNCAKYPSPDLAQRAFLSSGGPQKDRYGIDPDGDGYACGWNPEPFRRAVGG